MRALLATIALLTGSQAGAQPQPGAHILAQAADRCMTTYAVRLTHTAASDEEIYRQASDNCAAINSQLKAAIGAEFPKVQAAEIIRTLDAQAKPNFIALLTRIRSDRAARPAK